MFASAPKPSPLPRRVQSLLRHARRCCCRVSYWLRQFRSPVQVSRCCAWRPLPPTSAAPQSPELHGRPPLA
ncbi:hypothetical protein DLM_3759 [Aquitalea magnusonii]|uniref:Uncharacterized protein n=1 Tax=Aquitalea magnusonii TaxID=332411 RepID=A0A3G9GKK5_9NEIS|nr:hypothetical protein DLM_3759 [Aquitalea magnusonii]